MTLLCILAIILIILIQFYREKNIVNVVTILAGPYLIIFALGNFVLHHFGFYIISNSVLELITASIIVFYLGTCLVSCNGIAEIIEEDNKKRFDQYNIKAMAIIVFIIVVITSFKFIYLFKTGQFSVNNFDDAEGVMGQGVLGHMLLMSYSLIPILFLYWLENKKKIQYLLLVGMVIGVTFSTFVKYNVIGVVVNLFLFSTMYKRSVFKRGIIILISLVALLFISNYALSFMVKDSLVNSEFYFNHFLVYLVGSVIYDNYIFDPGINSDLSIFYKLRTFLCAIPNMFINVMGDEPLYPHIQKPFYPVSIFTGEVSNVTDAFGYLFPSNGSVVDVVSYFLVILIIGILISYIYVRAKLKRKQIYFNVFITNFLTYFVFFSFFGTFYINPGPWEICIYSLLIPSLFLKGTNLRKGIIRLP